VVPAARGATAMAAGEFARYVSYDGDPVVDINTGEGALPMPRLRPRLALLAGEAPPDKFVSLPLAEIAYQNESYARTDFVPPLLQVTSDGPLGPTCVHLVRRVREKALFLADRARAAAATAKRPLVLETQLAAQRLACALPPVEALLRAGVTHPFPLFVQCCDLLGQVAAAGTSIVPPVLDAYDHANLRDTFRQITRYVDGILDGIQEAYRPIPFRRTEAGFELALDADWLHSAALILGGVAPAGVSDADLAVWLENSLIASQSHMTSLRERRVRGPARRRVDGPDAVGLAPRRGEVLLSVATDAHYVDAGDTLHVMNPADGERGRPDELVLYVATRP
jgi:type VI secretion system protein ImpJ